MPFSNARVSRGNGFRAVAITTPFLSFLLFFLALAMLSCGSGETQPPEQPQTVSQEENAQALGRIMGHRNQLQGELNEPVEAVISGDVTAVADAGEETWILVKVADFRLQEGPPESLKAVPGSELSVRLRKTPETAQLATGDSVEINALVSKSVEGPVILGRAYRVME